MGCVALASVFDRVKLLERAELELVFNLALFLIYFINLLLYSMGLEPTIIRVRT